MNVRRATIVEDLAQALAQAFHAARLYPAAHPERARREKALRDTWKQFSLENAGVAIDCVQGRVHADGGAPLRPGGPGFADFAKHALEAGMTIFRLEASTEEDAVVELVRTLALGQQPDAAPAQKSEAPVDTGPLHLFQPPDTSSNVFSTAAIAISSGQAAIPSPPPSVATVTGAIEKPTRSAEEERGTLRRVWEGIRERRSFDRAALAGVIRSLARRPGDGVMEPVALLWSEDLEWTLEHHALNAAHIVFLSARATGLRASAIEDIVASALLADIGMTLVPERLRHSRELLRPAEFRLVRRHPVDGARILFATQGVPDIAGVVAYQHHQRVSGRGYPHSSRQQRPVPAAQLVQVADLYAALRTPRPFRPAVGEREARAMIRKTRGEQVAAEIVDLMLDEALPRGCCRDGLH